MDEEAAGRIPNPAKEPARDGRLVAPNESGGTNYRSPSFDPRDWRLLIVSAQDAYGIYFFKPEHGEYGWAGADYGLWSRGMLRAIDYQTGKLSDGSTICPRRAIPRAFSTTATGVTFSGDSAGSVIALRTSDGSTLWHSAIGRVGNSPVDLRARRATACSWSPVVESCARGRCRRNQCSSEVQVLEPEPRLLQTLA